MDVTIVVDDGGIFGNLSGSRVDVIVVVDDLSTLGNLMDNWFGCWLSSSSSPDRCRCRCSSSCFFLSDPVPLKILELHVSVHGPNVWSLDHTNLRRGNSTNLWGRNSSSMRSLDHTNLWCSNLSNDSMLVSHLFY